MSQAQFMMQSTEDGAAGQPAAAAARKPRIAIMGEFSAGKSTLSNLLIGSPALPVKVTATQLPPVWIADGDAPAHRIGLDGRQFPLDLADLQRVSVDDTRFIRVFHRSEVLDVCDLIDMPGISDPNMPAEVWERVADHADAVIWCTHATQAWRQSEAAVWETFSPELHDKSLLLLTRVDKLMTDRDRQRVVRRVERETDGLFRGVFPISLTEALNAGEDFQLWKDSGADAFAAALMDLAQSLFAPPGSARRSIGGTDRRAHSGAEVRMLETGAAPRPAPAATGAVMPRRVAPPSRDGSAGRTVRPARG